MSHAQALAKIPVREWEGLLPAILPGGRFQMRAVCAECGAVRDWSTDKLFNPGAAVKRAKVAGWQTGKHIVCPECQKTKKEQKMSNVERITPKAPAAKQEPTDAAKKAKRMVYLALEDYYDDAAKGYRAGHTDKSVADEIGVAEAFVASIRESDFGPIKEPDEVTQLRAELSEMASEIGKAEIRVNKVSDRVAKLDGLYDNV